MSRLRFTGLSMVELLVTLGLMAILLFFCLPFSHSILQKNQLELVKNEITAAIHYARNKAIIEGQSFVLSPHNDWSEGMLLFADNKDHQLIHQWQWKYQGIRVSWKGLQPSQHLIFPRDLNHASLSGHFIIEAQDGARLSLILNRLGRVRSK